MTKKYLEAYREARMRESREKIQVKIVGKLPNDLSRQETEKFLTEDARNRHYLILPLSTQIAITGNRLGYNDVTIQALTAVGIELSKNPNISPEEAFNSHPLWKFWNQPIITNDGERLLYSEPQYVEEIFDSYRTQIEPELVPSDESKYRLDQENNDGGERK